VTFSGFVGRPMAIHQYGPDPDYFQWISDSGH
jgi:hypothetical protein